MKNEIETLIEFAAKTYLDNFDYETEIEEIQKALYEKAKSADFKNVFINRSYQMAVASNLSNILRLKGYDVSYSNGTDLNICLPMDRVYAKMKETIEASTVSNIVSPAVKPSAHSLALKEAFAERQFEEINRCISEKYFSNGIVNVGLYYLYFDKVVATLLFDKLTQVGYNVRMTTQNNGIRNSYGICIDSVNVLEEKSDELQLKL